MPTATKLKFNIVSDDGEASSVTFFHGGQEYVATPDHNNFAKIIAALKENKPAEDVVRLFDLSQAATEQFAKITDARLSDRVLVVSGIVLFDGMAVDDSLTKAILGFLDQGVDDWKPLVLFMEKIAQNPNQHSQKQLFSWLQRNKFAINSDGDIIAYKGVNKKGFDTNDEQVFESVSAGRALVNGRWVDGRIPTSPGTIVEMPRDLVHHNPNIACSTGLHAGDWSYASTFASVTLRVLINPRDVVSVPNDSSYRKMRVCRYRVLGPVKAEDKDQFIELDQIEYRTRVAVDVKKSSKPKQTKLDPPKGKPVSTAKPKLAKASAPTKKVAAKAVPAKAAAKKVAGPVKKAAIAPKFYEEFKRADFLALDFNTMRWLAKEWEVKSGSNPSKAGLVDLLTKEAAKRNRQFTKGTLKSKTVKVKAAK